MYAVNIKLQEQLQTSSNMSMADMESSISLLPGEPISGINEPAAFVGQDGACFCLHTDDCQFIACNRQIAGAYKIW